MKIILITLILGTFFLGSLSHARSCRDEPESCLTTKMICTHRSANKVLTAIAYDSLFSGSILKVSETVCNQQQCHQVSVVGQFQIRRPSAGYSLFNLTTGEAYPVQCSKIQEQL